MKTARKEIPSSHLPVWLYELLPSIYIIGGALVASKLDGLLAVASGSLLITAGLHVMRMRRLCREVVRRPVRVRIHARG